MLGFLFSLILASTTPSILTVPIIHAEELTKEWTQDEVKAYALEVATEYGLHKYRFLKTLECENGFNAKGQSNHYHNGVRERSFGSAQINLYWNPTITQEQAENPYFALPWMADEWILGNAWKWSCYTSLFGTPL